MTPSKLPSAPAVYLKIAESTWSMFEAEAAGKAAPQWLARVCEETFSDAMSVGFSGSREQWAKEVRAAGDRIGRRLRQPRRSVQSQ